MATESEARLEQKRDQLRRYIEVGPAQSAAMGINHLAVFARDLEATADFYSNVLGMPVISVTPNRDEPASTHMIVDVGNGVGLAFFDFPHVPRIQAPAQEGVGGTMHVAISIAPERFQEVDGRLTQRSVRYQRIDNSVYFKDPNGMTVELLITEA